MNEDIQKAFHSAECLTGELIDAHGTVDPMTAIVLLPLIEQATRIKNVLSRVAAALET